MVTDRYSDNICLETDEVNKVKTERRQMLRDVNIPN